MTEPTDGGTTVLVVDDEEHLADMYATQLPDRYDARTANGGEEALERIDDGVDVVLLDRRMPDLSGDEVLEIVRRRGIDCRIAMVTAVDPDFDILEMELDDYLVKSVTREQLIDTVERLALEQGRDRLQRERSSKEVRRNVLSVEKSADELERSEEFAALESRIEEIDAELRSIRQRLEEEPPRPEADAN